MPIPVNTAGGNSSIALPESVVALQIEKQQEFSGLLELCNVRTTTTTAERFPFLTDVGDVEKVAEGGRKPVSKSTTRNVELVIDKFATIQLFTDEFFDDLTEDPTPMIEQKIAKKFAQRFEAELLGWKKGVNHTTTAHNSIREAVYADADNRVTYDTSLPDALRVAIADAEGSLADDGFEDYSVVLHPSIRTDAKKARIADEGDGKAVAVYDPRDPIGDAVGGGVEVRYSNNLNKLSAGTGKVIGVVGDFSYLHWLQRKSLEVRIADQATLVDTDGSIVSTFQDNMIATRWECRGGGGVADPRAFRVLVVG